jgi:predicted HicB family RNase H-like nuclease
MKKTPADTKRRRAASREGMRMISVALPVELHRQLALAALDTRIAMNEIVRDAIKLWLARAKERR